MNWYCLPGNISQEDDLKSRDYQVVVVVVAVIPLNFAGVRRWINFPPPQLYVYFVAVSRLRIISNLEGRFEEAIIAYLFLVNLVPILLIPMMWYESKKVAQLLNSWSDFEVGEIFELISIVIERRN